MPSEVLQFLATIAIDPDKLEGYLRDPEQAMRTAGLSEPEISLIKSGDAKALEKDIGPGDVPVKHYYYWADETISSGTPTLPLSRHPVAGARNGPSIPVAPVLCVPYIVWYPADAASVPAHYIPFSAAGLVPTQGGAVFRPLQEAPPPQQQAPGTEGPGD